MGPELFDSSIGSSNVYPNFLYIGAAKAGSTWIYEAIREHPQAYVPSAKDIKFFYQHYEKGLSWYLSFFKDAAGKKAIGEIDHDLFLNEENADRIHKTLPDTRLICCLREPIEWTMSFFLYCKLVFLEKDITFESLAFDDKTLRYSDYYFNLKPFYERFNREKILVLFFDDLETDPLGFARSIYQFLEINTNFCPQVLNKKITPASEPRLSWFAHFAFEIGSVFRKLGKPNVVGRAKMNPWLNRLLYKEITQKPEISEQMKRRLKAYYLERYRLLPGLIGKPLPEKWF